MDERLQPRSSRMGTAMTLVAQKAPAVMKPITKVMATITQP